MEQEVGLRQSLINEVNSIRNLSLIVTFTGLVFLSTSIFFIAIPASNGFFNIGEAFVYLAALIGGPITGAIAGGLGASMADLALGYGIFAPATAILKAAEGFAVGLLFHYGKRMKKWLKFLFIGIICSFLIVFSAIFVNQTFEFGISLYGSEPTFLIGFSRLIESSIFPVALAFSGGRTFIMEIPGYAFLIIALILSTLIVLVVIFLKEKGEMALSCTIGGMIIVLGYFFYETVVLNFPVGGAAVEIPFNIAQVILGAAIAIPIVSYLRELGIIHSEKDLEYSDIEEDPIETNEN